jgi:hypothetical protein
MNLTADSVTPSIRAHTIDNRFRGAYQSNLNLVNGMVMQQRFLAFYNAPCCGIAFEYRSRWLGTPGAASPGSALGLGLDRGFFLTFKLVGLGTFPPIGGGAGGSPW